MNEGAILEAIKEYNRYHSPEAIAELEGLSEGRLTIRFRGPFCESCGVSEWFEDLAIELRGRGISASIEGAKEASDGSFLVSFAIGSGDR
ncbi:MAG: hypothetical protein QXL32_02990 [Candidatus Bathyarchaeia archaeon]